MTTISTKHAWLEFKGKVLDVGIEVPHTLIAENVSETEMAQPLLTKMFLKEQEGGDNR